MNWPEKPSRSGVFFSGKRLTTDSISSMVRGLFRVSLNISQNFLQSVFISYILQFRLFKFSNSLA